MEDADMPQLEPSEVGISAEEGLEKLCPPPPPPPWAHSSWGWRSMGIDVGRIVTDGRLVSDVHIPSGRSLMLRCAALQPRTAGYNRARWTGR